MFNRITILSAAAIWVFLSATSHAACTQATQIQLRENLISDNEVRRLCAMGHGDELISPPIYDLCIPRMSQLIRYFGVLVGMSSDTLNRYWLTSDALDRSAALDRYWHYRVPALQAGLEPRIIRIPGQEDRYVVTLDLYLDKDQAGQADSESKNNRPVPGLMVKKFSDILKQYYPNYGQLDSCHFQRDLPHLSPK